MWNSLQNMFYAKTTILYLNLLLELQQKIRYSECNMNTSQMLK